MATFTLTGNLADLTDKDVAGAEIYTEGGHIQMLLDASGAGGSSNAAAAVVNYSRDARFDLTVGTGMGRAVTPYPLYLGPQVHGCRINVMASRMGCANPTTLRPGSEPVGTNVINFGP